MSEFVGTGWAFRTRRDKDEQLQMEVRDGPYLNGRGGVATSTGAEKIEQAIRIILETPIGSRVMRSTFGSRLHELLFAPINSETLGLAEMYVEDALSFWEPRIELVEVNALADNVRPNIMKLEILYTIKATHDQRSLVYPFYRIPGE